jgi:type VI secretion system protein ImpA
MTGIEKFLEPISAETPCGADLSYDPALQSLENDIKGKPETQFSSAEEPNWREMQERTVELMGKTKDLRLGVYLSLVLLKTEGMGGFRDGVRVLHSFVEQHWEKVYPLLDPEDPDPVERANILNSLSMPVGTFQDPHRFLERIQEAPLCRSQQLGRAVTWADVKRSQEGAGDLNAAQIEGLFRESDKESLQATVDAVSQALEHVKGTDAFLTSAISTSAPSFDTLEKLLADMQKFLLPFVGGAAPESTEAPAEGQGQQAAGVSVKTSGAIGSRQDVVKVLDAICDYYKKNEPSSPVPLVLRRAQRLVDKDFMAIIEDLAAEALPSVRTATGQKADQPPQ